MSEKARVKMSCHGFTSRTGCGDGRSNSSSGRSSSSGDDTFAGLYALKPRVLKLGVTGISTFFEPRATAGAATECAAFFADTALGARGSA